MRKYQVRYRGSATARRVHAAVRSFLCKQSRKNWQKIIVNVIFSQIQFFNFIKIKSQRRLVSICACQYKIYFVLRFYSITHLKTKTWGPILITTYLAPTRCVCLGSYFFCSVDWNTCCKRLHPIKGSMDPSAIYFHIFDSKPSVICIYQRDTPSTYH